MVRAGGRGAGWGAKQISHESTKNLTVVKTSILLKTSTVHA